MPVRRRVHGTCRLFRPFGRGSGRVVPRLPADDELLLGEACLIERGHDPIPQCSQLLVLALDFDLERCRLTLELGRTRAVVGDDALPDILFDLTFELGGLFPVLVESRLFDPNIKTLSW